MAPLYGWGPKGKRLRGFAPHGQRRTLTFSPLCATTGSLPRASSTAGPIARNLAIGRRSPDLQAHARKRQCHLAGRAQEPLRGDDQWQPPLAAANRQDHRYLRTAARQRYRVSRFRALEDGPGARSWFCDPNSPWQKGAVESTDKRICRFVPSDTDLPPSASSSWSPFPIM